MNSKLCSVSEIENALKKGKSLLIAGDEGLLRKIPHGSWIGGTIPYFMSADGGVITKDQAFVTELPDYVVETRLQSYDATTIKSIYADAPTNGFSVVILPATSPVHLGFATDAPGYQDFAVRPLVGWISGVHLNDLGKVTPKTFNGATGEVSESKAVVLQARLPEDRVCDVGIVNIFEQGAGDSLEFLETGFSVREVLVNGTRQNFAKYLLERKADVKLPLVANYGGAMINISFQSIDEASGVVNLYAPVFKGVLYKQAGAVGDYVADFNRNMPKETDNLLFSCNCILNFLYSNLEGKKTGGITGPITFGEVAYQLLNQTLVYLTVQKV